jgi:quercetin 2,3-dioxygenase
MSNLEARPVEMLVGESGDSAESAVEVLTAREVPLGGPRAMRVRRTLPQRSRTLIGAWCFADHYGPQTVATEGGMVVPPHPHTGLQTVSWLFAGEVEHRDSLGTHALIRPGELNIMTGGYGICHSEVSTTRARTLHGVQLWVALPDADRAAARDFQHYAPPVIDSGDSTMRVFLGELAGARSPVRTFTPLLGAEVTLAPRARLTLDVDPGFEHGVLLDTGSVTMTGTELASAQLGYASPGASELSLANLGDEPARMILLGGPPFGEQIVMWWNFVARGHEEVVAFREAWQAESDQFGRVDGYQGTPGRLPAPALPNLRLRPRLPGNGAVPVLEGAGRPVGWQGRQRDDGVGTLGNGLGAAMIVEVGAGETRIGRVHQNARQCSRVLHRQHGQRRLGGRVDREGHRMLDRVGVENPVKRSDSARHVDDPRLLGRPQQRQERVHHPDRAEDVDRETLHRDVRGQFLGAHSRGRRARVVDQDVQMPVVVADPGGRRVDAVLVGGVDRDVDAAKFVRCLGPAPRITGADQHRVPKSDQPPGRLVPEALVGAGDECDGHGASLHPRPAR